MAMLGKIKNLLDDASNPAFPVTVADAVFVDNKKTLAEKLRDLDLAGTYVVKLADWGFITGFPNKPYQTADYATARNNMIAFNNVLDYASRSGYEHVLMPPNVNIAVCFCDLSIYMTNNVTLNLNGCTLKVIYDSDNRQPYDNRTPADTTTNPTYKWGGIVIVFKNVKHSHLMNGIILGDAYDRSWTQPGEAAMEGSYGVSFTNSSRWCSVSHCKISAFMGDNINYVSYGDGVTTPDTPNQVLGDIDASGSVIASTTSVVTALATLPKAKDGNNYDVFQMGGQGYSRKTSLTTQEFFVYYYKADGTYLGSFLSAVGRPVQIPSQAAQFRCKFQNETLASKNMNIFYYWGGSPMWCTTEYNELFFGHRGGITGGGSYNYIQYNWIHDNGGAPTFFSGQPIFPDSTRYAINQEDSYGDNIIIKDNIISGGTLGILVHGYSTFIENNMISTGGAGVVLYDLDMASIRGNYFRRCGVTEFGGGSNQVRSFVNIAGNHFYKSGCSFHDDYQTIFTDNLITDSLVDPVSTTNARIEGNTFRLTDTTQSVFYTGMGEHFTRNTITAIGYTPVFYVAGPAIRNNEFTSCEVRNNRTDGVVQIVDGCKFSNNSSYRPQNYNGNSNITNSTFIDSYVGYGNVSGNGSVDTSKINVTNCSFETTATSTSIYFFYGATNFLRGGVVTVDNCTFTIRNTSTFQKMIGVTYGTSQQLTLTIKNSTLTSTSPTTLVTLLTAADSQIYKSYMFNNKYSNLVFSGMASAAFSNFDPTTSGIDVPTTGFFTIGDRYRNSAPVPGSYEGWYCLSTGFADNSAWTALTSYSAGGKILSSGKIYEAQNTGYSSSLIPTLPATVGGTVQGTNGTTTWAANKVYNVNDVVVPPTGNGYFYQCTTAGTSAATAPATWSTTDGATMMDGTATWTVRTTITWKMIGVQATFKPYGMISQ
jgi:hypothetical protein